ncbi:cell wall anchor protein [Algibacter sp. L3A6]|uniref:cell wall anchor protein n=1 Tax=Algibacter sp. L3A6 TaxID=2686366 RepID=UPI00131C2E12|nr:cell wall anchor protein [Algibacter sp. L3A6]
MKNTTIFIGLLFLVLFQIPTHAQVGIGTTTPDASSILDIESTTQGILTPRMTTAQRIAIASPAEGLMVFDIDEGSFFYFDGTVWVELEGSVTRDNYKLVKSAADLADELAAGGGAEYLLTTDFMYEINGTITLAAPINLNGAYLIGEDTNEDILMRAGGTIFEGDTGGSIRGLTLVASGPGAAVFNLTGSTGTERFVFRDSVVANSTSVGTISSFGLVFVSIVQYVTNAAGITYSDIDQLLLNSEGWASDNGGIYQTFTGEFDIILKQGGFSKVIGATAAIDVTGVSSLTSGNISKVNFYGGGNYVNGSSPYVGYDFSNKWDVNTPGLPVETDGVASGNFFYDGALTSGFAQTISGLTAVEVQGAGTFTSNELFRFVNPVGVTEDEDNELIYDGVKPRNFQVNASLSVRVNVSNGGASGGGGGGTISSAFYAFMIAKNGTVLIESSAIIYVLDAVQIQNVALSSNVSLNTGDSIAIYVQKLTGTGSDTLAVFSENLSIK